jgi:hypothetical protein
MNSASFVTLLVNRPPMRIQDALMRRAWDGENGVDQFLLRRLHVHRNDESLNELRGFGTDHVCAKKLSNGRVEVSRASPQITSTLFFLRRPSTPRLKRPATSRERLMTDSASNLTLFAARPLVLRVTHLEDLRGTQKRLCRNAPPIEADSAEVLALHDGSFEPQLRRADAAR